MSLTPQALADTGLTISSNEIKENALAVAELLDYIRWLAEQDSAITVTAGDIWGLYYERVRIGRVLSEVCEEIGLLVRDAR